MPKNPLTTLVSALWIPGNCFVVGIGYICFCDANTEIYGSDLQKYRDIGEAGEQPEDHIGRTAPEVEGIHTE